MRRQPSEWTDYDHVYRLEIVYFMEYISNIIRHIRGHWLGVSINDTCRFPKEALYSIDIIDNETPNSSIHPDYIRVSVGIEDIEDIKADLDQALKASQE